MAYQIKVSYSTGDSFNTWNTESILGKWANSDVAKENLKRIKEHYEWIRSYASISQERLETPDFVIRHYPKAVETHNYPTKNYKSIHYEAEYGLWLKKDDGSEEHVCASWIGYFEHLQGAEIISEVEDGWSFSF